MAPGGKIRRIGVLTGGWDCPGLNAVIRAVVKTAIGSYRLSVVGFENGFGGLIQNRARDLTMSDVVGILPRGGTIPVQSASAGSNSCQSMSICKAGKSKWC